MDFLKKNPRFAENEPVVPALDKGNANLLNPFHITDIEFAGDCKIATYKTVDLKNGFVCEVNFIEKDSLNIATSQLTDLKVGDTTLKVAESKVTMPVTVTAGNVPLGPNTITTSLAPKALPGTVLTVPAAPLPVVQVPALTVLEITKGPFIVDVIYPPVPDIPALQDTSAIKSIEKPLSISQAVVVVIGISVVVVSILFGGC